MEKEKTDRSEEESPGSCEIFACPWPENGTCTS